MATTRKNRTHAAAPPAPKKRAPAKRKPVKRAAQKRTAIPPAEVEPPPPANRNERTIVNEAQRLLVEARTTLGQLATACGVSRGAASKWLSGLTKPTAPQRKVVAKHFGPVPELWDQAPATDPHTEPPPPDEDEEFDDAKGAAFQHLRRISRLRRGAEMRKRSGDLHKLLDLERRAILDLAKFSGELTAADESRLTETKRWLEVRRAVIGALSEYPPALKSVVSALEEIGA